MAEDKAQEGFLLELYTETFHPGMILEHDAYSSQGEIIVHRSEPVTKEIIERLKNEHIDCLYYSVNEINTSNYAEADKCMVVELEINKLYPGMALQGDAYTPDGRLIAKRGQPITGGIILELEKMNIKKFHYNRPVYTALKNKTTIKYVVSNELIEKSLFLAREIERCIQAKTVLPKAEIDMLISKLVGEISISETYTILNMLKLKQFDDHIYVHSINTAMLAILFGRLLMLDNEKLKIIGTGGLLHDLGKMLIPLGLLNKPGKLTDAEWLTMQKHPQLGREILETQKNFHPEVADCILHHHENYDGSGYPDRAGRESISDAAQIVAMADYYDAVTSPKPYRPAYPVWFGFLSMQAQSGKRFNPRLVTEFMNRMPVRVSGKTIIPLDSYVMLNTQEIGKVIKLEHNQPLRPMVKIYINGRKEPLKYPIQVDLQSDTSRTVIQIIEDEKLIFALEQLRKAEGLKSGV